MKAKPFKTVMHQISNLLQNYEVITSTEAEWEDIEELHRRGEEIQHDIMEWLNLPQRGMKPKVGLALPLWRIMYGESVCNLVQLLMTFPFHSAHIAENFRVDRARERMTESFLATDGHYMFCLDSDMIIPQGAIDRLLAHKLPLVGGLYVSRSEEHWPFIWNEQRDEMGKFQDYQVIAEWPEDALIPCDITGAGFLLIAREVFESFGPPWWILDEGDEGGTDIAFLRRAKQAGWQLYVDTGLQAQHLGIRAYTLNDFISWRAQNEDRVIDPATEVEHGGN